MKFRRTATRFLITICVLAAIGCRGTSSGKGEHIQVKLVSDQSALTPGSSFTLGILFQPEPGWHIYWKNPGDSGLAPRFAWESSDGISVQEPLWPFPKRITNGPLVNYGYEEALIPFQATLPQTTTSSRASVVVSLQWLVCKEECVPGETQLELSLPVTKSAAAPSPFEPLFAEAFKNIPTPLERVSIAVEEQGDAVILALIPLKERFFPSAMTFFPEDPRVIANAGSQEMEFLDGALRLTLKRDPKRREAITRVRGVLVAPQGWSESGEPKAVSIDTNPGEPVSATAHDQGLTPQGGTGSESKEYGFIAALLFALLGGLLLNVMPCVFPVLSIKLFSFMEQSQHDPRKVKLHSIAFSAGVIVSFWIFACTLLALRAGGEQLGWGFQLQSPTFVVAMIFTFMALGFLFLSDVAFAASLQRFAGRVKVSSDYAGSFFNGALATAVASPCTGPFMSSALAATLTLSPLPSLLVFTMLGVGMSLPYLVLAFKPGLLNRLPRPGAWMETVKEGMAFPLFGTSVWLIRVFARQMGLEAHGLDLLTNLLLGLLLGAFGFWVLLRARGLSTKRALVVARGIALASFIIALFVGFPSTGEIEGARSRSCLANESGTPEPDEYGLIWQPYSEQRVALLLSQGRSVYLDFTAEWCITCQVNKRIVFSSSEVRAMIVQKNVALVRGDWTSKSPSITAALRRYGRNGVPLNIVIPEGRDKDSVVLPSLLTPSVVLAELGKLR